ncbi:MAG: UTP--glucose-1-phosphate uridylyltransferase [Thermoleophilaceae bacterium]
MSTATDGLTASLEKMRREELPQVAMQTFAEHYRRLTEGERGMLPESELVPVDELPGMEDLPEEDADAAQALDRAVVIRLNGGLGTSMGMTGPKSLVEAKDGLTFLDIAARQVLGLRERHGARLPLVLMNSFRTRGDTLAALERYPELPVDVPLDFLQGKVPKVRADDLQPVSWDADPELEWAPPGHGDVYTSLVASGMLEALLERGYQHALVSNIDNVGSVLEPRILAWFARKGVPFLMEVTARTDADRKGGHLARRGEGGGLVLREIAQTPEEDRDAFQDVARHRFFNTNTLWIDLRQLGQALERQGGLLGLPLIVNRKHVDPSDASSPEVLQLESAMGAAIGVFDGAAALRVPRTRFAPVKTTNDLLVLRSDAYRLTAEACVELAAERGGRPPFVDLDPDHFKLLGGFEARFPSGPPSLAACERLTVAGDVAFGAGVLVRGSVSVEHAGEGQLRIDDGAVLEG